MAPKRETAPSAIPACPTRHLTPRELEVAYLLLTGMTTRDIALQLDISNNTLKSHLKNMFAKFDAHSQRQLVCRLYGASSTT
ncbi:helix-turn-helix transcriptional regulator [Eggerthella guodeyinii]|uniref:Helix-turn-helix transcriptional regulator n=1 Tax=Eggerthella guodeyinii TaxID=2690837 RepID=A0A6L7IQ14_9ACTN|nr:helix-turn-helix transcriptional regulator [Eggerthella guodeyinii]QOS68056.1 helix-turn-helix transcriptional regulator [Eggerthella guodeyinii]